MRDYALIQARSAGALGISLTTLITNWRVRRNATGLRTYDSLALHQLGITREDVYEALRLPLTENPQLALRAFARSPLDAHNQPIREAIQLATADILIVSAWKIWQHTSQ